ncbi:MAG TPA: bifunctional serine/threonine-protein kinase/formylglycine-generating enzyme family protein [Candidatus Hydrogenedentes bacterium]|nr:bifunctional serine/threonine-protein kinase/formylglycine-generating enzyme family protein [Candidatus Hydrogenedentota bacterium]HOL77280.1 bifunctional serine/threonine-protein kinase/formylglycine-generating enzyme family protein [Candidatus Hydrogenedentota bacterium]HPO85923.1 bifunctional serine/threonine-protein kinase/formylglycine-generating enzyme family protein [Candidatus Hydrogenedentota bacterium]
MPGFSETNRNQPNSESFASPPPTPAASHSFDSSRPPFSAGDCIADQFEVVRVLGIGGMGVVYEVIDRLTRQHLALKQIRFELAKNQKVCEYFLQEVAVARRLRHPNIVAVYDVRKVGDLLFYTMELLDGDSLRNCMKRHGRFALPEAAVIMRQLCLALEHAHEFTVHRDVSPENVMVTRDGIKLLDFGIAKVLESATDVKRAFGKTYYTAPEQLENSATVDARADIYSLGVMLFEMLTGLVPKKPLSKDFTFPGLSPDVCRLIAQAVAPVEERFSSVYEFRLALEQCAEAHAAASQASASETIETPASGIFDKTPRQPGEGKARPSQKPPPSNKDFAKKKRSFERALILTSLCTVLGLFLIVFILIYKAQVSTPVTPSESTQDIYRQNPPLATPKTESFAPRWQVFGRKAVLTLPKNVTMEFVRVRMGAFRMGSGSERVSDASPSHEVTLTQSFWIGKTEVTQAQWEAVMHTKPWANQPAVLEHPDAPAVYISWYDAQDYLARLNTFNAGIFRLPTEAEWEYACRAGDTGSFCFGDDADKLPTFAWFQKNTRQQLFPYAQPVGQKSPNTWGLFDVHGNVAEWCHDWYSASYYTNQPVEDPQGPLSGVFKVIRGGSWRDFERSCTCFARDKEQPTTRSSAIGFRICRAF